MTATELNEHYGLPGILDFDLHGELTRANITLPACAATVYLQGAHLTHWQPAGQKPVLFLSEHSGFEPGKAIRGGVPICFPWFAGRSDGKPGPSHGFARTQPWELVFAALLPGAEAETGASLQLTFTLGPTDLSRSLGFDGFRIVYELRLGSTLTMRLTVANRGDAPLHFEEALHSYFAVGDVRESAISGLESAPYLDKRDGDKQKTASAGPLELTGFTDRVFLANVAATAIHDGQNQRVIRVAKQHSATTVVWNPWEEGAAPLTDLGSDEWPRFLAVEAANTAADSIVLAPGETHTLSATVTVEENT